MKSVGNAYWNDPNTGAINSSGFTALPGGYRNDDGSFGNVRDYAFFWSATKFVSANAWNRNLYPNSGYVNRDIYNKTFGASVRCPRD
jgi:uncharacterized protein (TIGR02145 family)